MQATSGLGLIYAGACGAGTRRGEKPSQTGKRCNNEWTMTIRVGERAGWREVKSLDVHAGMISEGRVGKQNSEEYERGRKSNRESKRVENVGESCASEERW